MKKSTLATLNEAIVCKYSGKKYIAACQKVLCILLPIALVVLYVLDLAGIQATVNDMLADIVGDSLPIAIVAYAALVIVGVVAGLLLGLIWGGLVNMFRVPSVNKKEQKSYLDMSALRVQLDSQRTILCEGDAKVGKLAGRLYVTAGAVEYYAGSDNNFTNYFLIPLYDVNSVSGSGKKLEIATKRKKFTLKVAPGTAKTWKKSIKEAIALASAPAPAKKTSKKDAKKAKKANKKAAKKAAKKAKKSKK